MALAWPPRPHRLSESQFIATRSPNSFFLSTNSTYTHPHTSSNMSDLQRNAWKAKMAMPAPDHFLEEEEGETDNFNAHAELALEDDSSSASSASSASSTGTIIPSSNRKLFARPQGWVCVCVCVLPCVRLPSLMVLPQNTQQENHGTDTMDYLFREGIVSRSYDRVFHHNSPRLSHFTRGQWPSLCHTPWCWLVWSFVCRHECGNP